MLNDKINEGFTKQELRVLERSGFAATLWERRDGAWTVFLYDAQATNSDVVTSADGARRVDAIRESITRARKLPRCPCGGAVSDRYRTCVRCYKEISE